MSRMRCFKGNFLTVSFVIVEQSKTSNKMELDLKKKCRYNDTVDAAQIKCFGE